MWKRYTTINDLPEGLWNQTVARYDACLDSRLIRTVEQMHPGTPFYYWLRQDQGQPSALFMVMIADDTPFYGDPALGEKRFRTASTGTPETSGLHLWYDERFLSRERLLEEMLAEVCQLDEPFEAIVFRDFIAEAEQEWGSLFVRSGFQSTSLLEVSELTVPEGVHTLDDYIATLKSKHRYQIGQYRSVLDRSLYAFDSVTDYLPLLDELYPLYLEVSARAHEYTAEPYPPAYFHRIKASFGDDACMLTLRERATGCYLGFMLLLYGRGSCVHQYIGFHRQDDLFLWHNLTIESIGDAISRGVRRINMGVTHAQAKHKFGAKSEKNTTFVKMDL